MKFRETPLSDVIDRLGDLSGINFFIDPRGLSEEQVAANTKVTIATDDVRLSTLLDQVLTPLHLDFAVSGGVVKITSRQLAKGDLIKATYPIGDLSMRIVNGQNTVDAAAVSDLIQTITTTISPETWDKCEGPGSVSFNQTANALVVRQTREVQRDIQELLAGLRHGRKAPAVGRAFIPKTARSLSPAGTIPAEPRQ